ncbi:hypothetical protein NIES4071_104160 (plasmid) [Calothrix sp. NIES-4071]|nr:hypothetical protein NIES4071_104160 [Calothrix sp. NIES-4071]BAZ64403.1 hypothetical protein NIES4105_101360 [Calothrix sp. NIES-4105]
MSLTKKINAKSPILEWFEARHNAGIDKIINNANQHLAIANSLQTGETLKSSGIGLIKAAAVYGLLKHIGYINGDKNWIASTYASKYIQKAEFDYWMTGVFTKSITEEAIQCLVAGASDISYRLGQEHKFLKSLSQHILSGNSDIFSVVSDKKWTKNWNNTINDAELVIKYLARCHKWEPHCLPVISPTFHLSNRVGGAEADLIIGDAIVSIVVEREFKSTNLYELLAYTLLDTNDVYSIKKLIWVFPLRQTSVILECSKLFRNIQDTRKQFKVMIEQHYAIDEFNSIGAAVDTLKYSSH